MCCRVEVLALVSVAVPPHMVHTHSHCVISAVDHRAVSGVSESTVRLSSAAAAPLKLPTHLHTHKYTATSLRFLWQSYTSM